MVLEGVEGNFEHTVLGRNGVGIIPLDIVRFVGETRDAENLPQDLE